MNIQKALASVQTFTDLHPIVQKAHPNLSWLGTRYISVEGYDGTLPIDALAIRTTAILRKNFDFPENERPLCREIAESIDLIYEENDMQVRNSNWLTWIICKIRALWQNIFDCGYNDWSRWELGDRWFYEYYTRTQYKTVFGYYPLGKSHYGGCKSPERWMPPKSYTQGSRINDIPILNRGIFREFFDTFIYEEKQLVIH